MTGYTFWVRFQAIYFNNSLFFYKIKKTNDPRHQPLPSLVICPPTLTGHWCYEVEKFISKEHLNPLHYTGPPAERQR